MVLPAALAAAVLAVAVPLVVAAAPSGGARDWFSFLGPAPAGGHHGHREADDQGDPGEPNGSERGGAGWDNGADASGDRTDWSEAGSSGSGPTGTAASPAVERSSGVACTREVGSESGLRTALTGAEPGEVICIRAGSSADSRGLEGWTPDAPAEAAPKRIVVQLID
jgi:hypothetical protein